MLSSFLDIRLTQYLFFEKTERAVNLKRPVTEKRSSEFTYNMKQPTELTEPTVQDIIKPKTNPKQANANLDFTRARFPTFTTYETMLEDDTHVSNSRNIAKHSLCSYQGLRKPLLTTVSNKSELAKCRRTPLTPNDCAEMVKYFGQYGSMKAGQCNTNNAVKICTVSEKKTGKREDIQISCDDRSCKGKRISIGLFNVKVGKIKWRVVNDIKGINTLIKRNVMSSTFASGFALLKCGEGIQILSFPKILKQDKSSRSEGKRKLFNINIVVEDSLSRAHFYRTLLKTASTFREIIYNQSIPSTVLEYEKVQSYASNTYSSLQRLFTAQKYMDSTANCQYSVEKYRLNDTRHSCTYGFEEMFSRFKKAGFSTLLQEDHCWYDHWGSFLEPRKQLGRVKDEKTQRRRWKDFVKLVERSGRGKVVDDYGISLLSCDVYKKYNQTNPFNSRMIPNVCFAGRHYASSFLDYVKKYTELNDMAAQPFIAYTHLLTSHDTNGRRIVNDDESLADLFHHAAHLRNTVTIFASDHGAKATTFAAYTTQGRLKVYQPFLFMIIPHEVTKLLGPDVMNALVVNQNRLVGIEDLHYSLVSILDNNSNISRSNADNDMYHKDPNVEKIPTRLRGLFQPIPLDRTCEQMKLESDVLCLCEGMDKTVSNDSKTVQWAAEFALGTLNNRIQEQYTKALKSKLGAVYASSFYGYGACQRYTGVKVICARNIVAGLKEKLLFSLLVRPFGRKTVEIFDVEVAYALKQNVHGITMNNLIRISPFNEYENCADVSVDEKLCACDADDYNNTRWRNELFLKIASQENFTLKSTTQILDEPCLVIINRARRQFIQKERWQNYIETYEAINACTDVTYELSISFKRAFKTKISLRHASSVMLLPRTVTFLLTAINSWKHGIFVPRFKFKKSNFTN